MLRIICPLHSYHQLQRVTQNYQFWEGFKNVIFDGSLFAPSFLSIPNAYVYLFLLGSMCQGLGCLSVLYIKSNKNLLGALPKDLFLTSGVIDWLDNSSEASNIYVTSCKFIAMNQIGHNKDGS